MTRSFQGADEILIYAPPEQVWSVLEDSTFLPRWAPMVKRTTGKEETVGSTRSCEVEWEGRQDHVVERCVEAIPHMRIAWVMEQGMMTKMFSEVRFGFDLQDQSAQTTCLRLHFLYQPRYILARLMFHLLMKRKLAHLRQMLLANIKNLVEGRA